MLANSTRGRTARQRQGWVDGPGAEQGDQALWERAEGNGQPDGSEPCRREKRKRLERRKRGELSGTEI